MKDDSLCSVIGCNNIRMKTSNVCSVCYSRISDEMAKTISDHSNKTLPITDRTSYISLNKLINGIPENEE